MFKIGITGQFLNQLQMRWNRKIPEKNRRNLEKWELGKIALKLKPEIEAKARANQGTRTDLSATLPESSDTVDTRKELAEAVGLGERTMGKVMQIDENAPEVIKEALDKKELSINKGYDLTRQLQDLPEEQREQAAAEALEYEKAKKENPDAVLMQKIGDFFEIFGEEVYLFQFGESGSGFRGGG